MIIRLDGGLGNTLFQYAYGKAQSKFQDVKYTIADSFLQVGYEYQLDKFNTKVEFVIAKKLPTYYWQDEKYFLDVEKELRQELTLKDAPSVEARGASEIILNRPNSVFLHVRRGDYDGVSRALPSIILPVDYYERAIKYIEERVENAHFFVFSDEPWWVEANLNLPRRSSILHFKVHEDLWLMSQCRHAVLANSTLSWWGAWIGQCKYITIPKQWNVELKNSHKM
jgi:hypothetical protein